MAFNNGPKLVTQGLNLLVDAGDPTSYPGTGTTWRDVVGGQNGIITGSVSYTSSFYGGLVFSGPTASVIFPTSSANFGTGSFTVELAFRPARIEGIHYLVSKNSGSFPNWGIYLSGSGGSGKLFSEFRISSTVSCSVSSSTTFVTGSNYFVDVIYTPLFSSSAITVFGNPEGTNSVSNGSGALTSTGSLLAGNPAPSSSQAFSGSLYNIKVYTTPNFQSTTNYAATATRLGNRLLSSKQCDLLVVGAGGAAGAGFNAGGGGGAGGTLFTSFALPLGTSSVFVGSGGTGSNSDGAPGQNSFFASFIAQGGRGGIPIGNSTGIRAGNSGLLITSNNIYIGGLSYYLISGVQLWMGGGGAGINQNGQDAVSPTGTGTGVGNKPGDGGSGSYIAAFAAIGGSPAGWFGGGGAGGYHSQFSTQPTASVGGPGGGGNYSQAGVANTGGGGGGYNYSQAGGTGGSGIVAIRYSGIPIAVGGEITQSGGFTYHVFRQTGSSTFTVF
jgi:hypothetical protein